MPDKSLWIMRGLPGSGKSTAAKVAYPHVTLSTDDYFMVGGRYCWSFEWLSRAHAWNQWRADQACANGESLVIIDNTNTTWKEIKPYVDIGRKYGYEIHIVEPNTSWKFDVQGCLKRNTHMVPVESIQKMLDRWESTESIIEKILKGSEE